MRILRFTIILFALIAATVVSAQEPITSIHGSVSDDMEPLMGASVCEMDGSGRIIESTITDLNGNFTHEGKESQRQGPFQLCRL